MKLTNTLEVNKAELELFIARQLKLGEPSGAELLSVVSSVDEFGKPCIKLEFINHAQKQP